MRILRRAATIACLMTTSLTQAHSQAPSDVTVTPLLSTNTTASGQPLVLPTNPAMVGVSRYVIAPGARLAVHKHPHTRYAYVQSGNLTVFDADTGRRFDYKRGDFIVEILDGWHYGENAGTEPVELLVIDQTPDGSPVNTVLRSE